MASFVNEAGRAKLKSATLIMMFLAGFLLASAGSSPEALMIHGVAAKFTETDAGDRELNAWTWVGGSDVADQRGIYGAKGKAAAGNFPGPRRKACSWTDRAGNAWIFGGEGFYRRPGEMGLLNDLWKYSKGQWTWMGGSNLVNEEGSYGTIGTAAAGNIPGARESAATWTDPAGNLWLFGGSGLDSTGRLGFLDDLWKYNAGQWTWIGGSNVAGQKGVYGAQGTAAARNKPGGRAGAIHWTDSAGDLWLFGGEADESMGEGKLLNDLWKYSSRKWTWMSGSNLIDEKGTYGTQRAPAADNIPGARTEGVSWTDAKGDFWLFGGFGYDSAGTLGELNDLWKYSAGRWTWMGGSNVVDQKGTYGTQGTADAGDVPGARQSAVQWTDAAGNFWLFGGEGPDSNEKMGELSDLWMYSAGEWTWMKGPNVANLGGIYGTQGAADAGNVPGGRDDALGWTDAAGNLWLFGGVGRTAEKAGGFLNDLWKYER